MWVNQEFNHFVSYAGTTPWTDGALSSELLPAAGQASPLRYVPEHWAALVDDQGVGPDGLRAAAVSVRDRRCSWRERPGEFGSGANYFRPHVPFMFGPGSVLEGDVYVIAGDYRSARQDIGILNAHAVGGRSCRRSAAVDAPTANQAVSGIIPVAGWVLDNVEVARVEIFVDGDARRHRGLRPGPARRGERLSACASPDWLLLRPQYQAATPMACTRYRSGPPTEPEMSPRSPGCRSSFRTSRVHVISRAATQARRHEATMTSSIVFSCVRGRSRLHNDRPPATLAEPTD